MTLHTRPKSIKIVEVGPRDGLQNEPQNLSVRQHVRLVEQLINAGCRHLEIGAFVSPKWVPQMAHTLDVLRLLQRSEKDSVKAAFPHFSVLVPNEIGMEKALGLGLKEVAVFAAASESFSKKNINCSINDSLERFSRVFAMAQRQQMRVRAYLSTAFGCPFEGLVPKGKVIKLAKQLVRMGAYEVSIGDTIGVATPAQVRQLLPPLIKAIGVGRLALHFHATRGAALANVLASLDLGVRVFDSSIGGLGGCPYATGASGNLATEDLAYMLQGMRFKTGLSLQGLIQTRKSLERILQRKLPAQLPDSRVDWF